MSRSASSGDRPARVGPGAWVRKVPVWAVLVFSAVIALAYSPNVLQVSGIHNDYEALYFKSPGFFHTETEHLFSVVRPVAALFSNLTILPIQSMADYRWARLFSILTVCLLGTLTIANCIFGLRTRTADAVAVALAAFLVPPFIYSVLQPAAWAPHLLAMLIALGAYTMLSSSNLQSVALLGLWKRRNHRALWRQIYIYSCARPVWGACLVFQLALYDYPPNALILAVFPVIAVLFSQAPRAYRTLIALRDIVFIGANLVLYSLSAKLIYLPFIRLFTAGRIAGGQQGAEMNEFEARIGPIYRYDYNTHPGEMLNRLWNVMNVAGDLWFLPQIRFHLVVGVVLLVAIVIAGLVVLLGRRQASVRAFQETAGIARLGTGSWAAEGHVTILLVFICLAISSSPVLGSGGGFVTYRTIAVATAIAAIVFIYAVSAIAGALWSAAGNPLSAAGKIAGAAMALTICAAFAACLQMNYLTMKLARNEFAYFSGIIRQAIDNKSLGILLVDPRPFSLPEDHPMVHDQQGRAIPPYELGCLSGYCVQSGAILHIATAELGHRIDRFRIYEQRGNEPVPGLTCDMITGATPSYPPNASARSVSLIKFFRSLAPVTCLVYSLDWHDLGVEPGR